MFIPTKPKSIKAAPVAAGLLLLILLIQFSAAARTSSVIPARDVANFGPIGKLMFWQTPEKIAGFRNMNKLYDTRTICRGDQVYPLIPEPVDLSGLTYQFQGEPRTLDDYIRQTNVVGFLVIKNNRILSEQYFHGNTSTSRWMSFSVTKSVVSMMVGAAVQDGFIKSIDDKVTDYIRHLKGSAYDDVSIKNLLQMASGVEWNEDYGDPESDVNAMPRDILELFAYLKNKKRVANPGAKFNYNTAETSLVGAVLRSAIGNNLSTYLSHKIWVPFGMEANAYWVLHTPGGGEMGGCCINATLKDYGRIGLFALQEGQLTDGTRVLPKGWMAEAITPSRANPKYGYLWWLDQDTYAARGVFGQIIYINPERNLVIVLHSAWPKASTKDYHLHRNAFIKAVETYLQ